MKNRWPLVAILVAAAVLVFLVLQFRAVDTRPLPQVQPTLDVQRPTQPTRQLAPTGTPTP